ncbi:MULTISPECIES: ATP-grasp domain-containing protein [unclassified Streptomyces]|uniref:ATP-grasp domain-containing protein n=1 Tax=unclassified Streptomyces TaxID=2593676 RepID=UPI0016609D43|nr:MULTISPECIES: ATP-grasp domain-containing protein [unclassified Streptomyces]MBD0710810.1 carboxylate--amine ligase [Streptomyces sp. CBMA291]MBD0714548.1 carboxylate--amine ligase [Streptomyces sp. CBMA370]
MTEHVLIVGGGREIPGLIRDAGGPDVVTTILCRMDFVPKVREPGRHDRVLALRSDAPDAEWIALAAAVHARQPFTRVGTFGERDQDRAAAVAAALGLPCHSPETIARVHDKEAMRRRLAELGVDETPGGRVADVAELRSFLARHGTPCVVKPVRGAGSFGVSVVRDLDGAEAAFARASADFEVIPDAGVLVERFHEGPQFSVEAFSEDGEHEILAVTRKFSDPVGFVELGHVVPAELSPEQTDAVHGYVRRLLDALGIAYGVTHTEVVLTADGPRVIETHVRLAGDEIPYLVHDVTGVDLVDCVVRQTLGLPVLADIRRTLADPSVDRSPEAIWFAVPRARGTLARIGGLDEAADRPGVVTAEALLGAGDVLGDLDSSESRAAFVRARGADAAEAVERARQAVAALEFEVTVSGDGAAGGSGDWI